MYTHNTLLLCQGSGVRWHLVYLIMLRCLELKEHVQRFTRTLKSNDKADDDVSFDPLTDGLTKEEWDNVQELVDFL